ncbi:MAG: FAD-binding protein [Geminicoccaceae bacterium]
MTGSSSTKKLIAALGKRIGERCTTAQAVREQHAHGESYHPAKLPDAVCMPATTEEVAEIVRLCSEHEVPITAFGAGTSLEGHVVPLQGGISLDMREMNAILDVHAEDMDATVQAGVTRKQLNTHLRDTGLFFPVDPGADATLGGMAATRASGTNAVRYGTMRENVVSLTVVMADGSIVRTASRAKKSSAGYDLTRIFVGSEGTLGIITEVTVRLYGIPEAISSASCVFETVDAAVQTAVETIQCGVPVARVELLDANANPCHQPLLETLACPNGRPCSSSSTRANAVSRNRPKPCRRATESQPLAMDQRPRGTHPCLAGTPACILPGSPCAWCEGLGTDVCCTHLRPAGMHPRRHEIADARSSQHARPCRRQQFMSALIDMDRPEELELAQRYNDRLVRHALRLGNLHRRTWRRLRQVPLSRRGTWRGSRPHAPPQTRLRPEKHSQSGKSPPAN